MFVQTRCCGQAELLAEIQTQLPPVSNFFLVLGNEIQEGGHNREGDGALKAKQHVETFINNYSETNADDKVLGHIPGWLGK